MLCTISGSEKLAGVVGRGALTAETRVLSDNWPFTNLFRLGSAVFIRRDLSTGPEKSKRCMIQDSLSSVICSVSDLRGLQKPWNSGTLENNHHTLHSLFCLL